MTWLAFTRSGWWSLLSCSIVWELTTARTLKCFLSFLHLQDGLKIQIGQYLLCLFVIIYFELSNIGVIARRLNLHISNRFTLDFVPHLP